MGQHAIQGEARIGRVRHGRTLEYFTIAYNSLEGLIALVAGWIAGSIALVGFGFDSVIEVTSGAILLWRLRADVDEVMRERVEARTLRIVGVCVFALAAYVGYEAVSSLAYREPPERSVPGLLLAVASLIVMPLLARTKRRVARGGSVAEVLLAFLKVLKSQVLANRYQHIWHTIGWGNREYLCSQVS